MKAESIAYLGLGSNLGDRLAHLQKALSAMASHPGIGLESVSSFFENPALGLQDHNPNHFLNAACRLRTSLTPFELLAFCQELESLAGRCRIGDAKLSRELDIDLLFYEGQTIQTTTLVIPHPRLQERLFVLKPLSEVILAEHRNLIQQEVLA